MRTKARAWIEDGVIRCCSQMCEVGPEPCPRIGRCKENMAVVDARRLAALERLLEACRGYRNADEEARKIESEQIRYGSSYREIDLLRWHSERLHAADDAWRVMRELDRLEKEVDERAKAQEKRQT